MKKKIFSIKLYLEGIRRLKLVGILTTVVLTVLAILIPAQKGISELIWHINHINKYPNDTIVRDKIIIDGARVNPFLFVIFIVIAPMLALMLFSFLSKRRTSDFYHSIPHTRVSIFLSFSASVLTWVAIEILASSLGAALTYLIFFKFYEIAYAEFLTFVLATFAASVLAVGAVTIAVSLTGTTGSNILLTLMILFIPRILIFAFSKNILAQTPILVESGVFPLFDYDYNLYTAVFFILSFWDSFFENFPYYQLHSIVYSLILGLIYLGLGLLFFVRRKSESAERSAPSRGLQTFYRTLLTGTYCLIPCALIFEIITHRSEDIYGDDIVLLVVLYIIALLIYFTYELITTRKWKNLLRAVPRLGIVAVVNLVVIGGFVGIRAYNLSFSPAPNEIKKISVIVDHEEHYYVSDNTWDNYVNSRIDEVDLDSDEIINIVSKALSENTAELKKSVRDWNMYGSAQNTSDKSVKYSEMTFKIHTKFGVKTRRLKISQDDLYQIQKLMLDNKRYFNLWTDIPFPAEEPNVSRAGYSSNSWYLSLPRELRGELTDTLLQEIRGMDPKIMMDIVRDYKDNDSYDQFAGIDYPIWVGTKVVEYRIPVSYRYMPKTTALILKSESNETDEQRNILEHMTKAMERMPANAIPEGTIKIVIPNSDKIVYIADTLSNDIYHLEKVVPATFEGNTAALKLLLEKAECRPVEYGEPFMEIKMEVSAYVKGDDFDASSAYYSGFIPLPSLTVAELNDLRIYLTPSKSMPGSVQSQNSLPSDVSKEKTLAFFSSGGIAKYGFVSNITVTEDPNKSVAQLSAFSHCGSHYSLVASTGICQKAGRRRLEA